MSYATANSVRITPQRAASPQLSAAFAALRDQAVKFWAACVAFENRRQSRRALSEMDERMLADIGVTRYEARLEASKPFWR